MKTLPCLLVATFLLSACKPAERVITGQVFIATAGGANVKLGGIQVFAVPAALAQQRERETEAALARELKLAAQSRALAAEMEQAAEEALARAHTAFGLWKSSERKVSELVAILANNRQALVRISAKDREKALSVNGQVEETLAEERVEESKRKAQYRERDAAHEQLKQPALDARRVALRDDDVLALVPRLAKLQWPEAVAQGTTDAEGKFTLRIRGDGVALVATGLRLVFKESELYFWRVPVPAGEAAEVMLTGQNARSMAGYFNGSKKAD